MCGIIGFNWDDKELALRMLKTIKNRGPDQQGTYIDNKVSLGNVRLSIIDTSLKGKQPIHNEDGSVVIVFNGEIYNYIELRAELESKGHKFYSNTDTEVIVHSYEEYGEKCVEYFNGCFAFAIWDSNNKKLFLARDRLGIKPLYYYFENNQFLFASEIKAILELETIAREVNLQGLSQLLSFRCNNLEETLFKKIKKVMPGTTLTFHNYKIVKKTFWEFKFREQNKNYKLLKKELKEQLIRATELRLRSDVPVGIFLSGGVDSGILTYLISRLNNKKIYSLTAGFESEENDERKKAREVAELYNTNHHEMVIREKDVDNLPDIVWHNDEPPADSTCLGVYLLAKKAKEKVKVILTGEGSDEIFSGYPNHQFMKLHNDIINKVPSIFRSSVSKIATSIPLKAYNYILPYATRLGKKGLERLSQYIKTTDFKDTIISVNSVFSEEDKKNILSSEILQQISYPVIKRDLQQIRTINNIINKSIFFDVKTTLTDDLLMKIDKNTMAWGVEGRVPYLDHNIVELSTRISPKNKSNLFRDKIILRETFKKETPLIVNQKKEFFNVPVNKWLKKELLDYAKTVLDTKSLNEHQLFKNKKVEEMFSKFKDSETYYARQIWTLMSFQLWYERFIINN